MRIHVWIRCAHLTFNHLVEYICPMEPNYRAAFTVKAAPETVFGAITRVADWWTVNTEGSSAEVGDEFTVQFGDVHRTTQRVVEAEKGRSIRWRVTESRLPWLRDPLEWKGTEIVFEITSIPGGTRLAFTHIGLTPQVECFAQCEKGWDYFIGTSLHQLVTRGVGLPDTTERTHMDTIGHVRPADP